MTDCSWPWHNDPECPDCAQLEAKYADNLDAYLREVAERRRRK